MSIAGKINTASGIFGLANVVSILSGGEGLFKSKGYYPSEWGHSKDIEEAVLLKTNIGGLFFDAVLSVQTDHSVTSTEHPVQFGANISDHSFINPTTITMNIGMSDAMALRQPGGYGADGSTKSIQAYRLLCKLQASRMPLSVLTRLNTYHNMVIESVTVQDDVSTLNGLRASIQLKEILMAEVSSEKASARAWVTATDNKRGEAQAVEIEQESNLATVLKDGGHWK